MTLSHKQDADATEIARLRAEIEKLKADNSKIAMEALSVEGELDAASGSLYNRTRELMEAKARIKEADLQVGDARGLFEKIREAIDDDLENRPIRHAMGRLHAEIGAWLDGQRVILCKHDGNTLKLTDPDATYCQKCGSLMPPVTEKRNCEHDNPRFVGGTTWHCEDCGKDFLRPWPEHKS